jgi:stage II sporulation protein D
LRKLLVVYVLLAICVLLFLPLVIAKWQVSYLPPAEPLERDIPTISVLRTNGSFAAMTDDKGMAEDFFVEDFLVGVVAAEMPAAFCDAALQAQAIAARTYILKHTTGEFGEGNRHGNAAVCDDPAHCQAYIEMAAMAELWGENTEIYLEKVRNAVNETCGMVLSYGGRLILAPYYSVCGFGTEAAVDVWGSDYAYLRPVDCVWDVHAPRYMAKISFSIEEAAIMLGVKANDLRSMEISSYTAGKRIKNVQIGKEIIPGVKIREALGLNSTNFTWEISAKEITFSTIGYGHGIGLCQYGADGMGKEGFSAAEILAHYYPGTSIEILY